MYKVTSTSSHLLERISVEYTQWFRDICEIPCSILQLGVFHTDMLVMTLDHKSRSLDVIVESKFVRSKVSIIRTWSCYLTNKFPTRPVSQWWKYKVKHMHTVLVSIWGDTRGQLCHWIRRPKIYFFSSPNKPTWDVFCTPWYWAIFLLLDGAIATYWYCTTSQSVCILMSNLAIYKNRLLCPSRHLHERSRYFIETACTWASSRSGWLWHHVYGAFRWLNRQDIHLKQYLFDSYETLTTSNWLVRFSYWVNFGPKRPFKPKDFHSRKLVTFEYDMVLTGTIFWWQKNGNLSRPLWHSAKLWGKIEGNFFVSTKNCLRFYGRIFPQ